MELGGDPSMYVTIQRSAESGFGLYALAKKFAPIRIRCLEARHYSIEN